MSNTSLPAPRSISCLHRISIRSISYRERGGRETAPFSTFPPRPVALWGFVFFFFLLLLLAMQQWAHGSAKPGSQLCYRECNVEDAGMNNRCSSPLSSHYSNTPTFSKTLSTKKDKLGVFCSGNTFKKHGLILSEHDYCIHSLFNWARVHLPLTL